VSFSFKITESDVLDGVWIIKPSISKDERGNIWTSFLKDEIEKLLSEGLCFNHDKFSQSKQNVLRGIHGDKKSWKLVTCVYGEILQVVVDCRTESNTYKLYDSFIINENNPLSILIPPGFGNAYYVISHEAVYHYKLAYKGTYVDYDEQFSFKWNDPRFNIKWPNNNPTLSIRDN